jgi:hypothetical protein
LVEANERIEIDCYVYDHIQAIPTLENSSATVTTNYDDGTRDKATPVIKQRPTEVEALRGSGAWSCYWCNNIPVGKEGKIKERLIRSTKTMRTIIVDDWQSG